MANSMRAIAAIGFVVLAAYIVWSTGTPFWESVDIITGNPWGQTTLVDLYLGFVLAALIIFCFERNLVTALAWALPIFVLGNVWTALWMIWRAPEIVARLRA